jgi:hypothetical protein
MTSAKKWDVVIVATDLSTVTLQCDNGETQVMSWSDWKAMRENRRLLGLG